MKYIATQNTEWNIDATYRILKCKKGIFIIATRDLNKKAFPLLFFIVPRESAECIAHVLQEYKKWVQYEPYCFINDCQKAIINSVKSTFSCEDFLCVFHIIRAVRHQINNKALTQEIKDYSITKIDTLSSDSSIRVDYCNYGLSDNAVLYDNIHVTDSIQIVELTSHVSTETGISLCHASDK